MDYKGFTLDPFQEDAIKALDRGQSVVVSAPTGSGKTLIADYIIQTELQRGHSVIYTAPIKALSNQKYKDFCADYGQDKIGLLTGDVVRNPGAPILIMTTEIYRNMALIQDPGLESISHVIFDEIHYINDIERGYVWEESIIFSRPAVRYLCLSATIPNAKEFAAWIRDIKQHDVVVVTQTKRNVPLHKSFYDTELGITTLERIRDVRNIPSYNHVMRKRGRREPPLPAPSSITLIKEIQDKLPSLFFTFSRKACQEQAKALWKARIFQEQAGSGAIIRQKLADAPHEIRQLATTRLLLQTLPYGIGFHHAGLIPIIKELVEELFAQGKIKVLFTTETFAVGINMPAKSVCFAGLRKFDGVSFRFLNSKEYFQIAGRAGRRGIDTEGFVFAMIDRRDFDYATIRTFTESDTEPIKSQFKLSVNTVLNLIHQHTEAQIETILRMNFDTYQRFGGKITQVKKKIVMGPFEAIRRRLLKLGYISPTGQLTNKGLFSRRIYSDEILTGEIFATDIHGRLTDLQTLLLLGAMAFEPKERIEFSRPQRRAGLAQLQGIIAGHAYLRKDKRMRHIQDLTAILVPCHEGKTIFDILRNTNMLEGDVLRFFRQILDRIGQIRKATDETGLAQKLTRCEQAVLHTLQDVDVI
ncbi:MAG: DEAD/DEAH box helicase [Nitrosarchaeum sp.]|nr:DEAD/DEAH box helicase [Nitrosarchaeum sp.]